MRPARRGSGVALAILVSMSTLGPAASAKKPASKPAPKLDPAAAGDRALAKGDADAARQAFAEAYRRGGPPSLLCRLGKAAAAGGQTLAAQDYVRRCLQEGGALPAERAELEALVGKPHKEAGEVIILGGPGLLVSDGDRLLGRLPLGAPLLLGKGRHTLTLAAPGGEAASASRAEVEVSEGRRLELRFQRETGAVMVSEIPKVALVLAGPAAETGEPFTAAVNESLAPLRHHAAAVALVEPTGGGSPSFAERVRAAAEQSGARYGLLIEKTAAGYGLSLYDPQVAAPAATAEIDCAACPIAEAAQKVREAVSSFASRGIGRPHGTLAVRSLPAGASVLIDGQPAGTTPFRAAEFLASYRVTVRHPGYKDSSLVVQVGADQPAESEVTLVPIEPPKPKVVLAPPRLLPVEPERSARPRWRLAVGGSLIALGLVPIGIGAGALAVNGQCIGEVVPPAERCDRLYDTLPLGAGLVAGGSALVVGGLILLAVPGPKRTGRAAASYALPTVATVAAAATRSLVHATP